MDVEVGSISQEPSSYFTCGASYDRINNQEIEASTCQAEIKKQELEFVFQLNLQNQIPTTTSNNCCMETQDTIKIKCDYDTKCVHTQTSQTNLNFIFTTNQCELIKPCDASICSKSYPRRISIQESNMVCCDQNIFPKNSKLKIYIYKTMSTDRCTTRDMPNVSNLSLPCKSNQLIVRLFETDPFLLDSCLILLRKRFEKDVSNACSCINDILKKFDDSMIKHFRLNCEIKHGRLDLNLVCKNGNITKSRWFLARIPTCTNVHKRDSCHNKDNKDVESCEKYGEPRKSMEIPIDPVCNEEVKIECCKELEERKTTFYSFCSNDSSISMESSVSKIEKEKEEEKEVNFVWSREGPKKMEFVLSSKNAISPKKNRGKAKVYFEVDAEKGEEHDDEISDKSESFLNEEKEETIIEGYKSEEIADEKSFTFEKSEIREFVMIGTENELTLCEYDYSSDSLKENVLKEDQSMSKVRDTEKCFSNNEFFSSDNLNQREQKDLCVTNEKIESLKKDYKECHLEENVVEMQKLECSHTKECEEYLKDTSCSIMKKDISMDNEICTCELRNNTPQMENCIKQEMNILSEGVVKYNFELNKNICQIEDTCKREVNTLEKKKNLEEKYSVDSISFVHSNSTKCSCCGKALSSPSDEEISETNKFCTNETILDSKVQEASNLIGTENISNNLKSSNLQYCKFQTSSIISSSPDRCYNTINSNATDSPRSCPNCEQNMSKQFTSEKISDPPVPESIFMFCKDFNVTNFSSTSDEESLSENFETRDQETRGKFKSPCRKSTPPCRQKLIHYTTCDNSSCPAKNFRRVRYVKPDSKCKSRGADGVRVVARHKSRRGSVIPNNLCSSFPAIDRIKYLIRKKLRKLLLEERDKGTCTSKTFLRTDKYLVSISSGKLNGERVIYKPCPGRSPIRCPFRAKSRCETGDRATVKTFSEGKSLNKNKNVIGDTIKTKCQKMIQNNDIFKRIKMADVLKSQKCDSKKLSIDARDLNKEKSKIRKLDSYSLKSRSLKDDRSSVVSLNSTRVVFFEDQGDHFINRSFLREKNFVLRRDNRNVANNCELKKDFFIDSRSIRSYSRKNCERNSVRNETKTENRTCSDKMRSFEKRLYKLERKQKEDNNLTIFLNDYERLISELDADFRLKLLQYVTLCRSVKNCLMKRLQPDDVCESSTSV